MVTMVKTKFISKKFILKSIGFVKLFLGIFFIGSSVFASGITDSLNSVYNNDSNQVQKKDFSIFVSRLSDRLQGVFGEILQMSSGVIDKGKVYVDNNGSTKSIDQVVEQKPQGLVDIIGSDYQKSIEKLVSMNVVDGQRQKFYPDNYLRRYEMIMMLVKYELAKDNIQFPQIVFTTRGWFADVAQNVSYAPYIAYADEKGWLNDFKTTKDNKKYLNPNSFVSKIEACQILGISTGGIAGDDNIKRGEFVHLLVGNNEIVGKLDGLDGLDRLDTNNKDSFLKNLGNMFAIVKK